MQVDSYEKYVLECEEKEKLMAKEGISEKLEDNDECKPIDEATAEKWKERRECLEMLKRELKRVRDGGDPYDWDHLLDDTEDDEKKITTDTEDADPEVKDSNISKENTNTEEKKEK